MNEVLETNVEETAAELREMPEKTVEKRKRVPLTHRVSVKVIAFIALIVASSAAALGVAAAVVMGEEGIYVIPEETFRESFFRNISPQEIGWEPYRILSLCITLA